MSSKTNNSTEYKDILCPYCQGNLTVSIHCMSMPCLHCNEHINVKEILSPSKKKKKPSIVRRRLLCFKCGKEISIDEKAQAVTCNFCYNRNDLSNYKVKSILGKNIETYGTLYLKKNGKIEISNIKVGNAIVKGKINGNLNALGTVEILKRGEIYGKITCRKLIVKKGGVFKGNVQMLN
ncbi:MAG: polymer-forming cytoskeletal protein [Candidatus Scalinduaceae bacterium]